MDGIAIVSAKDFASSRGVTLAIDVAVVALVVLMVVVAAHGGSPGGGPSYNADFAILDRKGKLLFYERDSVALGDPNSVAKTSSRFAEEVKAAAKAQ